MIKDYQRKAEVDAVKLHTILWQRFIFWYSEMK